MGKELNYICSHGKKTRFLRKLKLNFKSFDMFLFFCASLYYKNGKEFLIDAYLNSSKFCSTYVWIKIRIIFERLRSATIV